MKRITTHEQNLITEGRDLLLSWALATSLDDRGDRCSAVAAFLRRLNGEVPRDHGLPLFIEHAAFAAVISLAKEGKAQAAERLIVDLEHAAYLGNSDEGLRLLGELRDDLRQYTRDIAEPTENDRGGFLASVRRIFRLA